MEADDPTLFDEWKDRWRDLVEVEIVPVIGSGASASRVNQHAPAERGDTRT